jgi:hypothetical protein
MEFTSFRRPSIASNLASKILIDHARIYMQLKSHRVTEQHQKRSKATTPSMLQDRKSGKATGKSASHFPWSLFCLLTLPCPYLPGSGLTPAVAPRDGVGCGAVPLETDESRATDSGFRRFWRENRAVDDTLQFSNYLQPLNCIVSSTARFSRQKRRLFPIYTRVKQWWPMVAVATTLKVSSLLPRIGVGSAAVMQDDAIFTDVDALCTTCPARPLGISCTAPSYI